MGLNDPGKSKAAAGVLLFSEAAIKRGGASPAAYFCGAGACTKTGTSLHDL
jgi:hypothetical protein